MDPETQTKIKSVNPATVRVYNGDDDYRDVAVQAVRNRWSRLWATLSAMPWSKYELLDKKGGLVGIVENGAAAGDLEDIQQSPTGGLALQTRLNTELMLRAQREALTFRDKENQALLAGVVEVLKVMTTAMQATQQMYQAQVEAAHVIAQANAGGDLDQIVKLVEASPKLMATLAPIFGKMLSGGGTPPARKPVPPLNGAT